MYKYYLILGLKAGASRSEIKKAYYRLAKIKHPDVNKSINAEEEFVEISVAYKMLTDPKVKIVKPFAKKRKTKKKSATRSRSYTSKTYRKKEERIKKKYTKRAKMKQATFVKKSKNEVFLNDLKYIMKRSIEIYIPLSIFVLIIVLMITRNLLYVVYSVFIVAAIVFVFTVPLYLLLLGDYLIGLVKRKS